MDLRELELFVLLLQVLDYICLKPDILDYIADPSVLLPVHHNTDSQGNTKQRHKKSKGLEFNRQGKDFFLNA